LRERATTPTTSTLSSFHFASLKFFPTHAIHAINFPQITANGFESLWQMAKDFASFEFGEFNRCDERETERKPFHSSCGGLPLTRP
jgi:hypothetical protein